MFFSSGSVFWYATIAETENPKLRNCIIENGIGLLYDFAYWGLRFFGEWVERGYVY